MKVNFRYGKTPGFFSFLPSFYTYFPRSKYVFNKCVTFEFGWGMWTIGWAFMIEDKEESE